MTVKVINGEIPEAEQAEYVKHIVDKYRMKPLWVEIKLCGEEVELRFELPKSIPFERIRRITGYLVGTMDRWNDAKAAEEADRVKHSV